MREKSEEALDKFKMYEAHMSGLLRGRKILGVHSDNGGEFIGHDFKEYCKRRGILQTDTAPYAPEQNEMAERSNRTVMEMARCLRIIESGLDKRLWAEACSTAVYILNRVPTNSLFPLNGKTWSVGPSQDLWLSGLLLKSTNIKGAR